MNRRIFVPALDGILVSILRTKDLRMSLLIMTTSSFLTLLYVGGTYERLVYIWFRNIFCMIAVLIVFHTANKKSNLMKKISKQDSH